MRDYESGYKNKDSRNLTRLMRYAKPYTLHLILCILMLTLIVTSDLAQPVIIGRAVDDLINHYDKTYRVMADYEDAQFQAGNVRLTPVDPSEMSDEDTYAVMLYIEGEYYLMSGLSSVQAKELLEMKRKEDKQNISGNEITLQDGSVILRTLLERDTLKSLRSRIGVVQQDVYLFSGSIRDNIAYGKPDASEDEIIAAAKRANIHDFIMELPDQYDTFVGERGARLSGGQKQRISIARVFLKNPPILILDEATSALDNESERWIQHSLEELSRNRTTITIAHRLSTIKNADEIIVLTENGIAERGTHETLLDKNGIYAAYYMT